MDNIYEEILKANNIKPTVTRLLMLRTIYELNKAFSLGSLEELLETVDKSTLSRNINLFNKKFIIHSIDDGSGSMKYAISKDNKSTQDKMHVHFLCVKCKQTYCLEGIFIPRFSIPEGFIFKSINCLVKGLCSECSSKKN